MVTEVRGLTVTRSRLGAAQAVLTPIVVEAKVLLKLLMPPLGALLGGRPMVRPLLVREQVFPPW